MLLPNSQYLASLLIPLIYWILGMIAFWKYRKLIFLTSLIAFPQGIYALILVPSYWNPDYHFSYKIGIEDAVFSFLIGGGVWISIFLFSRNKTTYNLKLTNSLKRFIYCTLYGVIFSGILYALGLRGMENPFIVMAGWILIFLYLFPEKKRIVIYGLFSFGFVYVLALYIAHYFWDDLHMLWTVKGVMGHKFLGVVLGEYFWAFLYGASWSSATAYILEIK